MANDSQELLRSIGAKVRRLRRDAGLTVKELAARADLSVRFVSQLEAGEANIAVGRLARVATSLRASLPDLVRVEDSDYQGRPAAVTLLGLRGAGKSAVGPQVAAALGVPFVELDSRIEAMAGLELPEIFALHGEAYYRKLEAQCLEALLSEARSAVIELPGGIVMNEGAFALARRLTTTVWLRAKPDEHMARVLAQGDHRPMAERRDAMKDLRAILEARVPYYRQASLTVATSGKSVDEVVAETIGALAEAGWKRASPRP